MSGTATLASPDFGYLLWPPPLSTIERGGRGSQEDDTQVKQRKQKKYLPGGQERQGHPGVRSSSNKERSGSGCGRSPMGGEGPLSLALSVASGGTVEGEGDVCAACLFPAR